MFELIAAVLLIASVLGILALVVVSSLPRCPGPGEADRQAFLAVLMGVCIAVCAGSASVVIFPIELG